MGDRLQACQIRRPIVDVRIVEGSAIEWAGLALALALASRGRVKVGNRNPATAAATNTKASNHKRADEPPSFQIRPPGTEATNPATVPSRVNRALSVAYWVCSPAWSVPVMTATSGTRAPRVTR